MHTKTKEKLKPVLLEGSIKVADKILKPGEAFIAGKIIKTNIQQDVAWKNGLFDFNRVNLDEVMRQLSRWYDVQVIYERDIPSMQFYGKMGRDLTLKQVLTILEKAGFILLLKVKS